MKLHPVSLLLPLLAGCASTGGPSRTGGPPPRGTEPMTNEDILVVYSRGADGMLSDPRDAGLRDALELVDERVIEVAEMAGKDLPIPMLQLARDLLLSPLSFRADFSFGGGMTNTPFKAQLTVEGTPEEVRSIADRVAPLLGTLPIPAEPVEGKEGLSTLKTPVGPAYVGRNGDTFVASLGDPQSTDLGLGSMDLPVGIEPDFALKADFQKLQGPLGMGLAAAGAEGQMVRSQLELYGILGENPIFLRIAKGHDAEHAYFASRYGNYRQAQERQGFYAAGPLTPSDFAKVPTDATVAFIGRQEPMGIATILEANFALQQQGIDVFGMIQQQTGIDVKADLLEPLGATVGFYLSDETGGGGLASSVAFFTLDDRAKLEGTLDRIEGLALGILHDETKGFVGIRRWSHASASCRTLSFQGLPIPLAISIALTDDCLFVAGSPQALAAALDQAASGGPGLAANAKLLANVGSLDGLVSVVFQDTERLIRDGYGFASLFSSAIENGVRSPAVERGPDMVLPTYSDLVSGAQPYTMASRWEGDDLVAIGQSDPSFVANFTALLGTPFPLVIGAASAAVGATIGERRQQQRTRAMIMQLETPPEPVLQEWTEGKD